MTEYVYQSDTPIDVRDLWQTPRYIFEYFDTAFNFNCDVAASEYNHLVPKYFTAEEDALKQDWMTFNWCNPPYSDIAPWVEKAIEEAQKGNTTVMLVPSNTDTKWFRTVINSEHARVDMLIGGRIKFVRADTQESVGSNPRGSMFIIFSPDTAYISRNPKIGFIDKKWIDDSNHEEAA